MGPDEDAYFGGNSTCAQLEVVLTWADSNLNDWDKQQWEGTGIQSTQSDFLRQLTVVDQGMQPRSTDQCPNH